MQEVLIGPRQNLQRFGLAWTEVTFDIESFDLVVSGNDVATANAGRNDANSTTSATGTTTATK